MNVDPQKIKSVFLQAVEQCEPGNWGAFLDAACAGDATLRRRVEVLLEAHLGKDSMFDGQADATPPTLDQPPLEKPGTQIGPYKLLQQIGEGGFGVVYMAEQTEPVERRVAFKIIKPGMDTQQVIARFEAEEQALAIMDHPNIAKVHDAGTTQAGRPYFAMELVRGIPITQYCDEHHLTPRERLELFVPVCHAIQHAHQKGIIHRDIKPTNVLVAEYDDHPVPKIIDFGVAKAIQQRLTERTMFTQLGQVVGTIDYMSPEQAKLNELDIDTRSDIYSLGVLLYELLTGDTPLDRQRLRSAAFDEMLRIIREEEPPRPSVRLSSSDSLPSIAANRQIQPKRLSTLVRGELDWIVMKALEKDRTRRYETANELANDVQRYLNDEQVVACPPSAAYRFRKLVRRNKMTLVTGAIVAGALVVGVVGTTWQAIRATRERDRAVAAETQATKEAAIARAINEFLNQDLLAQADPEQEPDRDLKLRTVLDRAAQRIEGRFANQPLVEAAIRHTIGQTYQTLGDYGKARQHHELAWELAERHLGKHHSYTLVSMTNVAHAMACQGRYVEAEELHQKVLDIRRRVAGPEHPDTLKSMRGLANAIADQGRYEEAERRHRDVLKIQRRVLGPEHPDTLKSMNDLAITICERGLYKEAEKLWCELLEIQNRVLGPAHPDSLVTVNRLAHAMWHQGRYAEAARFYGQLLRRELEQFLQKLDQEKHRAETGKEK